MRLHQREPVLEQSQLDQVLASVQHITSLHLVSQVLLHIPHLVHLVTAEDIIDPVKQQLPQPHEFVHVEPH